MIRSNPYDDSDVENPETIAKRVARQLERQNGYSDETIEMIRQSSDPLSEPICWIFEMPISLQSTIRTAIISAMKDKVDKIHRIKMADVADDKHCGLVTHPQLLDEPERLLVQEAIAKLYQYGYEAVYHYQREGGGDLDFVEIDARYTSEFAILSLQPRESEHENPETMNGWFDDSEAIADLAEK